MNTEILRTEPKNIDIAAQILKNDEIVAIPTETVYGLAGNGLSADAVKKIFKAKGRPNDNPLILHISSVDWLYRYAENVPDLALKLAEKFWPGPLTMIMSKKNIVPEETSGGLDTVAFRMPNNQWTLKLIEACDFPLAAPSANLSGLPSPTRAGYVYNDMKGKIPLIIDGGQCSYGLESTVIAFTENGVKILRPGGVTPEMLEQLCRVEIDKAVTEGLKDGDKALSPGMKYKHYSPKAEVFMVKEEKYYVALDEYEHGVVIRSLNDEKTDLKNQGKSTDAVDDLIIKIGHAPTKKFKVVEKDSRQHDAR